MQNLGLVLLAFAFVLFFISAVFTSLQPHALRLIAGGLACLVAAELFGGLAALHYLR